jgi:hypothetical protein
MACRNPIIVASPLLDQLLAALIACRSLHDESGFAGDRDLLRVLSGGRAVSTMLRVFQGTADGKEYRF